MLASPHAELSVLQGSAASALSCFQSKPELDKDVHSYPIRKNTLFTFLWMDDLLLSLRDESAVYLVALPGGGSGISSFAILTLNILLL